MRAKQSLAFASVLLGAVAVLSAPADAACKKFGFTVNDYGKEGPTNDAKNLLDKHISEWATQNGVTEYQTGKKSVSCELFLDVLLFDEHTCTASATVCWGPDAKKLGAQTAQAPAGEGTADHPPSPVRKAEAMGTAPAHAEAAAAPAEEAAPQSQAAATEAAPTQPVEQIAAPAETPAAAPAVHTAPAATDGPTTGAVVETGALQAGQGLPVPEKKHANSGMSEKDRAAAASAAASAAAAAERAAIAAETAANAAKEAAAAAVAASNGSATVPPLDHASGAATAHNE